MNRKAKTLYLDFQAECFQRKATQNMAPHTQAENEKKAKKPSNHARAGLTAEA